MDKHASRGRQAEATVSLRESASSGVKWSLISNVARQGLQVISTTVLARLLTPTDFGLVGMAAIAVGFVGLFRDLGTAAAVVQSPNLSEDLLSSVFWTNVVVGAVATTGLILISPAIGTVFQDPRIIPLLRVLSFSFLVSSFSTVHQALLQRQMDFQSITKAELTGVVFGAPIGIGLAFTGMGSWSLVFQSLIATSISSFMLWRLCSWSPTGSFRISDIKTVSHYSLNLTGSNIFDYLARNADNFLIGKYCGPRDLGFYSLAYRIMCYPIQVLSAVVGRVMFPVYSRLQDTDSRFQRAYLNVTSAIAFLSFPLALGILATRELFVFTLFGSQWTAVPTLLLILVPVGLIQSVETTVGTIYQAKGKTDRMLRWSIVASVLVIVSFLVGLRWGIYGVASAYAIMSFILAIPSFIIPFRLINLSLAHFVAALWRPFSCSLVMFGFLLLIKTYLILRVPEIALLAIMVGSGVIVYFISSWFINREQTYRLADLMGITT
jgi:O-antigen/teichoic acid export membrane protein